MSSAADSLKQAATEAPAEEPTQKRVKIEEPKSADKSGATANAPKDSGLPESGGGVTNNNNNTNNSADAKKNIPSKTINGQATGSQGQLAASQNDEATAADDDDDELDELEMGAYGPKISEKLEQVSHIQTEICNLNEKASEEILKVEQKFNKLRRPHFEKRNEILKEIPNFWLTSMANHPTIGQTIQSPEDEDCLHYMVNLDVEEFEDIKSGYKLKLHFVENPYITNKIITKEFQVLSSDDETPSPSKLEKPIEYKNTPQGKKLKESVEAALASSRQPIESRGALNWPPASFFAWLTESSTDEIAEILKDQIWPNPLEFFFDTPETYDEAGSDDESDEDEEIDDEDFDGDEDLENGEDDLENVGVGYDDELADDVDDEELEEEDFDEETEK